LPFFSFLFSSFSSIGGFGVKRGAGADPTKKDEKGEKIGARVGFRFILFLPSFSRASLRAIEEF